VTYRRSALGSARFYAPEIIGSRRNVAIPDSHPIFDIVGLDATALAQVRFFTHVLVHANPPVTTVKRHLSPALLTEPSRLMVGQFQAPGQDRSQRT
jgi:hypothetical protein